MAMGDGITSVEGLKERVADGLCGGISGTGTRRPWGRRQCGRYTYCAEGFPEVA